MAANFALLQFASVATLSEATALAASAKGMLDNEHAVATNPPAIPDPCPPCVGASTLVLICKKLADLVMYLELLRCLLEEDDDDLQACFDAAETAHDASCTACTPA